MAPFDTESQFKFLLACIKHSYAGKVDFEEVAKECDCASKAAAARRYRKLMKTYNISPGSRPTGIKKEQPDGRQRTMKRESRIKSDGTKMEGLGDVDEPENVKLEVKTEDGVRIKSEHGNRYGTAAWAPVNPPPGSQRIKQEHQGNEEEDDEVVVVSVTQNQGNNCVPIDHNDAHLHLSIAQFPWAHSLMAPSTSNALLQPNMTASTTRVRHPYGFDINARGTTGYAACSPVWHEVVEDYGQNRGI